MTTATLMRLTQECASCKEQIPVHAWICPQCGAWVAEVLPQEEAEAERPAA